MLSTLLARIKGRTDEVRLSRPCPICGARSAPMQPVGDVKPTHPGPFNINDYRLMHCRHCDVVHLDPLPPAEDLRTLYQGSAQFTDAHYTDPVQVGRILEYYGHCLDHLGLLPRSGESVLEVGAGLAWVSRACKLRDAAIHTVAQDVSNECAEHCPWVDDYRVGTVEDLPREQRFRLISLTHVIEHLSDPAATLQELASHLTEDGKVFVTAPYRPTGWKAGQGIEKWRSYSYLHVPAHISYLSKTWFELVARRAHLKLVRWDPGHENGQAFEAILARA